MCPLPCKDLPCSSGYQMVLGTCWQRCPSGYADTGATCTQTACQCPTGQEMSLGACYEICDEGYSGVGPTCWQTCRDGRWGGGLTSRAAKRVAPSQTDARRGRTP